MRLGAESISLEIGGEAFELRPSLRVCTSLTARHGILGLVRAVREFNLAIILEVLREAAIDPAFVWDQIAAIGLGRFRERIAEPLSRFVLAVAGIDPDQPQPATTSSGGMSAQEAHACLFRIATGELGWPPAEAWNATPTEIIAARKGRTDLITDILKAIFGSPEKATPDASPSPEEIAKAEALGLDPEFDRAGLRKLKAKIMGGRA